MSKSIGSVALEHRVDALFSRYSQPSSPGAVIAVMRAGAIELCKGAAWRASARRADRTQDALSHRLGRQAVHRQRRAMRAVKASSSCPTRRQVSA
jgi:hypothetical protein